MIFRQKEIPFLNWFLYVMINNNMKKVYIKMVSCMDIEKDLEGTEMTRENKIKWKKSIQARQIIGFTIIILFMIASRAILRIYNKSDLSGTVKNRGCIRKEKRYQL